MQSSSAIRMIASRSSIALASTSTTPCTIWYRRTRWSHSIVMTAGISRRRRSMSNCRPSKRRWTRCATGSIRSRDGCTSNTSSMAINPLSAPTSTSATTATRSTRSRTTSLWWATIVIRIDCRSYATTADGCRSASLQRIPARMISSSILPRSWRSTRIWSSAPSWWRTMPICRNCHTANSKFPYQTIVSMSSSTRRFGPAVLWLAPSLRALSSTRIASKQTEREEGKRERERERFCAALLRGALHCTESARIVLELELSLELLLLLLLLLHCLGLGVEGCLPAQSATIATAMHSNNSNNRNNNWRETPKEKQQKQFSFSGMVFCGGLQSNPNCMQIFWHWQQLEELCLKLSKLTHIKIYILVERKKLSY